MPDEDFRPTHEIPHESRPTNLPPAWWAALARDDLPEGPVDPAAVTANRWTRGDERGRTDPGRGRPGRRPRWQAWLFNLALVALAALLLAFGVGLTTPRAIAAVLLVLGVLALLALAGIHIARRVSRRW
ncbi:MAG TPA: hypothetical protein VEK76_09370 [Candidatus Binatia bacterium]|nr:hypothetical protein [Candidatus Binatia bacterium]